MRPKPRRSRGVRSRPNDVTACRDLGPSLGRLGLVDPALESPITDLGWSLNDGRFAAATENSQIATSETERR